MNTPNIACYSMGRFTTSKPNYRFWVLHPNKRNDPNLSGSKLRVVIRLRVTPRDPQNCRNIWSHQIFFVPLPMI